MQEKKFNMTNRLGDGNRDYRLDMLRAISISLVLLWHLQLFRFKMMPGSRIGIVLRYALDIFNYQVSLVAVPVFVLVSLFLFYSKALENFAYFKAAFLRKISWIENNINPIKKRYLNRMNFSECLAIKNAVGTYIIKLSILQ